MVTRLQRSLLALTRQLGFRAAVFSLVAVLAALLARGVDRYVPQDVPLRIGPDAVAGILGVLASSMLAVTIFSLSTLVAALAAATTNVTPRARQLLQQDRASLNALSTFLGAFLFSLVGMIALNTGYYGERGRLVLFVATLGMAGAVVVTLLRWIDHVSSLGGVGETTARLEATTAKALRERAEQPALGARAAPPVRPPGSRAVVAACTGYVQHVDLPALQEAAQGAGATVRLLCLPGAFVTPRREVAAVIGAGAGDEALDEAIRQAITIDPARSFDQDPRFGLVVLAEVALRALSPAVNDPGTAIDVIGRGLRLLLQYRPRTEAEPRFPAVEAPLLDPRDLVGDAFALIARDGAGQPGVALRLQKALLALVHEGEPALGAAAAALSAQALALAAARLELAADREEVAHVATCIARAHAEGPAATRDAD